MIIPTDGGLRPGDAEWEPMREWLTANRFNVNQVPNDAQIEIRDGSCLGVELYVWTSDGHCVLRDAEDVWSGAKRFWEWHPMTQAPPDILLPVVP